MEVYRAPMRARAVEVLAGLGAEHGLRRGLVGTGDALDVPPRTLEAAVSLAVATYGEKAGRMLRHFADLPDGTVVWTRDSHGGYHQGRITGPWRYDDSAQARAVGIHHVRPAAWHEAGEVPAEVIASFRRG